MMEVAKQKARDLIKEIYDELPCHADERKVAKNIALIMVNLHLEELSKMKLIFSDREIHYKNWQEVKKYISYE